MGEGCRLTDEGWMMEDECLGFNDEGWLMWDGGWGSEEEKILQTKWEELGNTVFNKFNSFFPHEI